jgi:competence protein ComEC
MLSLYELFGFYGPQFQKKCLAIVGSTSDYSNISEAFLCGANGQSSLFDLFKELGLVHLLVVSGAHLVMLAQLLEFFYREKMTHSRTGVGILLAILLLFVFFTGAQPPTVRAFLFILLREIDSYFKWKTPGVALSFYTGLLILCLIPEWIHSFSFYLSWLASLGLQIPGRANTWSDRILLYLLSTFLIQILLMIFFTDFNTVAFFTNLLLGPLLAWLLWPLTILTALFKDGLMILDLAWYSLQSSMTLFSQMIVAQDSFFNTQVHWKTLWVFLLICHGLIWYLTIYRYRGHCV